jgi:hypothetical protein
LYEGQDEQWEMFRSFLGEGFEKGDKAFHIIDERNG